MFTAFMVGSLAAANISNDVGDKLRRDGVVYPLSVLSEEEVRRYRAHFDKLEAQQPGGHFGPHTMNLHLNDPVLWELACHPAVLEHAYKLTGTTQLRMLSTTIFTKYRATTTTGSIVGWHQDLTYWELHPQEAWALWIAIDDMTASSGALEYAVGLHTSGQMQHVTNPEDVLRRCRVGASPSVQQGVPGRPQRTQRVA